MEESIGLKRVTTVLFTYSTIMKQCVFMRKCDLDICQRQMKSDARDVLQIILELVQKIYSVFVVSCFGVCQRTTHNGF